MSLLVAELWPLGLEYHRWSKFFQGVFSSSDLLPCLYIASVGRRHSCQVAGRRWWEQWGGNDSRTMPFDQHKSQIGLTNDCLGGEALSTPGSHGCVWQSAGERPESLYPVSSLSYLQNQQSQWDHFSQSGPGTFFMGKMKYRAMQLPCAFTARAMVTDVPLSPEVTEPT